METKVFYGNMCCAIHSKYSVSVLWNNLISSIPLSLSNKLQSWRASRCSNGSLPYSSLANYVPVEVGTIVMNYYVDTIVIIQYVLC
uniref:Vacuolar protein sorting-associated protein 33 isoform 1 n=1 Tax=Rhizophora mucronata TaxID=61149 RepID=A0A2P2LXL9_RHIMU